ncbi:MAG: hypothetical protein K2Y05_04375 [Hyphomicrobiaceae bacterium]|nr:hypothetical protein [Hyphomicrobiaceae bacterium]
MGPDHIARLKAMHVRSAISNQGVPHHSIVSIAALVVASTGLVHFVLNPSTNANAQSAKPASPSTTAQKAQRGAMAAPPSNATLPRNVAEMRDAILAATVSARLEDLRPALQMNEMVPDLDQPPGMDPIDYLRSRSRSFPPRPATDPNMSGHAAVAARPPLTAHPSGPPAAPGPDPIPSFVPEPDGRDILDEIARILATRPAVIAAGRDVENSGIYVWPHFAERDWQKPLTPDEAAELDTLTGSAAESAAIIAAKRWTGWRIAIGADGTWHAMTKAR